MKKILILLAALLYIFAAEAQTKISQDSIESIQGQKVGRLRPVVSNGYYQQSSEGGDSYNQVLDTETGVPIESIKTGQEASDSLSANIARTPYGGTDISLMAKYGGGGAISTNISFSIYGNAGAALSNQSMRVLTTVIPNDTTITGIRVFVRVVGAGAYSNTNGVAFYSTDGTTCTKIAESANSGTIWESTGAVEVDFSTPVEVKAGKYYVCILGDAATPVNLKQSYIQDNYDYFGIGRAAGYINSQTTFPSTFLESTVSTSSSIYMIITY